MSKTSKSYPNQKTPNLNKTEFLNDFRDLSCQFHEQRQSLSLFASFIFKASYLDVAKTQNGPEKPWWKVLERFQIMKFMEHTAELFRLHEKSESSKKCPRRFPDSYLICWGAVISRTFFGWLVFSPDIVQVTEIFENFVSFFFSRDLSCHVSWAKAINTIVLFIHFQASCLDLVEM